MARAYKLPLICANLESTSSIHRVAFCPSEICISTLVGNHSKLRTRSIRFDRLALHDNHKRRRFRVREFGSGVCSVPGPPKT